MKKSTLKQMPITSEFLNNILSYNNETGLLRWKVRIGEKHFNVRFAGKVAGNKEYGRDGRLLGIRISVTINGSTKKLWAHRVIWKMMNASEPPAEIDHLDGDPSNNQWKNIRDGSGYTNPRNLRRFRNNTSGFPGVVWHKGDKKWHARIVKDEKQVYLGSFREEDLDIAVMTAMEARAERGYTLRGYHS